MKFLLFLLLTASTAQAEKRDPFWPFDFHPDHVESSVPAVVPPAPNEPVRVLTAAEVEKLAREESERIRETLTRRGTMNMAGNIYAYVQERWVTLGDTISVTVGGQEYRLLITRLTSTDIILEPHRIAPTTQNPGTRP